MVRAMCKLAPVCLASHPAYRIRARPDAMARSSVAVENGFFVQREPPPPNLLQQGPRDRRADEVQIARIRAKLFFAIAMGLAIPLFFIMSALYPVVLLLDRYRRRLEHVANRVWAVLSTFPFVKVQMEGAGNMPADGRPVVFVANHESYMDIFALLHLEKDFKFVSKRSIFSIPFVGWSMWLTGHIALDRQDAAGFRDFVKRGREMLAHGVSLAIFPEGTRSSDGKLANFKKGAFTIATKAHVALIPITLLGSGDVMPSGKEGQLHPGTIHIVVHPAIPTEGRKTQDVAGECRRVISSRLPSWKLG